MTRLERWAHALARHPRRAIALTLVFTALFGLGAAGVRLDNNFAALFSADSADMKFRAEHRDKWGADDGLLVAVVRTETAPTGAVVGLIDELTRTALDEVPELDRVDSVTTAEVLVPGDPLAVGPALGPNSVVPGTIADQVAVARASDLGSSNLVSEDGRTFVVVGELASKYDSYESVVAPAEHFETVVRRVTAASGQDVELHLSGVAYTRIAAIHQMQADLLKLSPLATLMLGLLLLLFFRRIAAVVGPLLSIGCSIILTASVIGLAGDDLNQVTVIYPILLMGVVVSSSAHLVHRYYRERANGLDATEAGTEVLLRVTRPAFVAGLTSAIGFASLVVAKMEILHEFGLYLAVGVMWAFVVQVLLVPAVLIATDSQPSKAYLAAASPRGRTLTRRFAEVVTRPVAALLVLGFGCAVIAGSALVASTASYDYALKAMLSPEHTVSQGNEVIDSELSGIIPIEVSLQGSPGDFNDPAVIVKVRVLADWLEAEYGVRTTSVGSLVVPDDPAATDAAFRAAADHDGLARVVDADAANARMRGFSPDVGGRAIVEVKDRFEAEATTVLAGTGITARVTGEAPVAYDGMNHLTHELVVSTFLAMALIVLAIGLVYRSLWLGLVGALPNVVPIMVGLAVYVLTDDVLDPLPGVVFCMAMGLAADDTIQLFNRWRELEPISGSSREALVEALVTVRKAMVTSTVTLVAGFLALTLSGFEWNRLLGMLGSLVLVLSLGADILFGTAGLALLAWWRDRRPEPDASP
ncbi:MAG TPA: MMPL family transporter [Nocardioidaceae bacterium]|nr:MMPL family transporter [Nocardioidaceae bacterium]